jgi:gliding motility-associated-like protein
VNADLFVHIPNAFTPNGDPLNSHFGLSGITQGVAQFKMSIYNRWGQQVFYSDDVNIKWDGTFMGKPVEQGVYVYLLQYTNPKQTQWYYFNGEVNLLR